MLRPESRRASIVVVAVSCAALLWRVAIPAATHVTYGFSSYYTAARLVLGGADASRLYVDAWFRDQTMRLGFIGAEDIYNVNPPVAALILAPLIALGPIAAKAAWTALSLAFLAAAVAIWGWAERWDARVFAAGAVLVVGFEPVREGLRLGQVYVLLLLLEVGVCVCLLRRRDVAAGGLLGLMLAFKTAGLLVPALLLAQRRWRALGAAVLASLAVVAVSLPLVGSRAWLTYGGLLARFGGHAELASPAYQSLAGLARRLFVYDPVWSPAPVADLPWLAATAYLALALAIVGVSFGLSLRVTPGDPSGLALAFAAWVTATIVLSPVSEDYHATLLLLPFAVTLGAWRAGAVSRPALVLALALAGYALIDLPVPYKTLQAPGALALALYPKLYGALALWASAATALVGPAACSELQDRGGKRGRCHPTELSDVRSVSREVSA